MMLEHVPTAQAFLLALTIIWAARETRPDRNYWPMLRVIWGVLGAVYMGSAWNSLQGQRGGLTVRVAFLGVTQLAIIYAIWFMRKRNRTPRFIRLSVAGELHLIPLDELQRATALAESYATHGAMAREEVARLRVALAEWDRKDVWRAGLVAQVRARKAQRDSGIPD